VTYDPGFYHADAVLGWLAVATLDALSGRLRRRAPVLAVLILASSVFWHIQATSAFLPGYRLPLSPFADPRDWLVTDHHRRLPVVAAPIGAQDSLSVQADLACFFTNRQKLYPFPFRAQEADWVLVDLTEPFAHRAEHRLFWLEYSFQCKVRRYCLSVTALLDSPSHELAALDDGYMLFRRLAPGAVAVRTTEGDERRIRARARLDFSCALWSSWTGRGYGVDPQEAAVTPVGPSPAPSPQSAVPAVASPLSTR
jgi:hypothetical protein